MPEAQKTVETPPPAQAAEMPTFAEQFTPEFREAHKDLLVQYKGKKIQEFVEPLAQLSRTVRERGIIVPDESSTPEERKTFHEKMNLPMTAGEYELVADEKLLSKQYVEEQRQYYFDHGFTMKQAQADIERIQATVKNGLAAREARLADAEKNYKANLVQAVGGDMKVAEGTENLAKKFIRATFSEKSRQELVDSGRIFDPQFIIDMANAQKRAEPRRRIDESGAPSYETPPGEEPRGKFAGTKGGYSTGWNEAFAESAGGR
jgi:hypothetical protein